jgi:hypothetical protein
MQKKRELIIATLLLTILILQSGCSKKYEPGTALNNSKKEIFTQWESYAGYSLDEESGDIQVPFLDFNQEYNDFCGIIKSVELLPVNDLIRIRSFNILQGGENQDYKIRTLSVQFDKLKPGKVNINGLRLVFQDNSTKSWYIGNWLIDIRNDCEEKNLELGIREIQLSELYRYKFTLKNVSNQDAVVKGLVFDSLKDVDFTKFKISDTYDNMNAQMHDISDYTLHPDEEKVFDYYVEKPEKLNEGTRFWYIKPFLKYTQNNKERLFPLDSTIYSGIFTDEDIKYIIANDRLYEE